MDGGAAITVVDTLVVHEGKNAAFAAWLTELQDTLNAQAGHEGGVVRLDQPGGIVHLLHHFADRPSLDAWIGSDRHRTLATAAVAFAISHRQTGDGPNPGFALPGDASAPKWKRVVVSWATVFPLLLGTSYAGQALVPDWPRPLTLALSSLAITVVLNLLVFPRVNRRLEPWLLEAGNGDVRGTDESK